MSGMRQAFEVRPPLTLELRILRLEVAFTQLEDKVERMAIAGGVATLNEWTRGDDQAMREVLQEVRRARDAVAVAARAARAERDDEGHRP